MLISKRNKIIRPKKIFNKNILSKATIVASVFFYTNIFSEPLIENEIRVATKTVENWVVALASGCFMINLVLLVVCYVSPWEVFHNLKSKVVKCFVITLVIYGLSSIFSGTINGMIDGAKSCPLALIGGHC